MIDDDRCVDDGSRAVVPGATAAAEARCSKTRAYFSRVTAGGDIMCETGVDV